jgi:carbon-monoxide dehydrogenase small subunit
MTIGFILNGEDVVINTNADTRLIRILRDTFGLMGAKSGCRRGICGVCLVILKSRNRDGAVVDKVVPSCLIPAFQIQGREITTIEGFSQTDEYQDIREGFGKAEVETCGYCDAGRILSLGALLDRNPRPGRGEILEALSAVSCRCTEEENILEGVLAAVEIRERRLYGRS